MSSDDGSGSGWKFPFDPSAFAKITLGPGLTGRISYTSTYTIVFTLIVAAILAYTGQSLYAFVLALVAIGTALWSNWRVEKVGKENPAAAIMSGSEFVQYTQIQQAAKDPTKVIEGMVTTNHPRLERTRGRKRG